MHLYKSSYNSTINPAKIILKQRLYTLYRVQTAGYSPAVCIFLVYLERI